MPPTYNDWVGMRTLANSLQQNTLPGSAYYGISNSETNFADCSLQISKLVCNAWEAEAL